MTFFIPSIDKDSLPQAILQANEQGFGIELFDIVNPLILNNNFENYVKDLKTILSNFEGKLSAHAPFYDLNPLSIDNDIKNITIKKYNQLLDAAKYLGITKLIFHTTYLPVIKLEFYRNYFIESTIKFWAEYIKPFEDNGITVLLENTYEQEPSIIKEIVTGVNSKNLKCCLDIGHVNINSKINVTEWIKCLNDDLNYMHLHNNNGVYDTHDSVIKGTGNFNEISNTLSSLKLTPDMSFEIFNDEKLQESINYVTNLAKV